MNICRELYTFLMTNYIAFSKVSHGEAYYQDLSKNEKSGLYGISLPKDFKVDDWNNFKRFFDKEYESRKRSWSIVIYLKDGTYLELEEGCVWTMHNVSSFVIHQDFLNFIWEVYPWVTEIQ